MSFCSTGRLHYFAVRAMSRCHSQHEYYRTFHNKYNLKYIHISSPTFVNLIYFAPLHLKASQVNAHTAPSPAVHQCPSRLSVHTTEGRRWLTGWWGGPSTRASQTGSPRSGRLSRFCDWLYWWRTWWAHCSPLCRHLWIQLTSESSEPDTAHCSVCWRRRITTHQLRLTDSVEITFHIYWSAALTYN